MANFVEATLTDGSTLNVNIDNIVFEIDNQDGTFTYLLMTGNYISTDSSLTE